MKNDIFWIPLDPKFELIEISKYLPVENVVRHYMKCMTYSYNGVFELNLQHVARICSLRPTTAQKVISKLLGINIDQVKDNITIEYLPALNDLETAQEKIKKNRESGKKGAETRWGNKEDQSVNNDDAIAPRIANKKDNILYHIRRYNVDDHLSDQARTDACAVSRGLDQVYLMKKYSEWINNNNIPVSNHDKQYVTWCKSFTKNYKSS